MADFIIECIGMEEMQSKIAPQVLWKLYIDGSTTDTASGASIILITPTGYKFHSVLRYKFEASNNEIEYEALLASLTMTVELKAKAIHCYNDSQLVVNQVVG